MWEGSEDVEQVGIDGRHQFSDLRNSNSILLINIFRLGSLKLRTAPNFWRNFRGARAPWRGQ